MKERLWIWKENSGPNPPWVPRDDCIAFIHIYLHRHRKVEGGLEGKGREKESEGAQTVIRN